MSDDMPEAGREASADTTAPDAITQAREVLALECEKHGFIEQAANIRAGNVSYDDGGQVCLDAMVAYAHRRLAAHGAGEGLREAAQAVIDRMFSTYKARNGREVGIQGDDGEKCWIVHSDDIEALRLALLTPPSDAGSTTREGGEGVLSGAIDAVIQRAGWSAETIADRLLPLATTPSPDASPDSGEAGGSIGGSITSSITHPGEDAQS